VANEGKGVLIATPYYTGFDNDLVLMNNVVPIAVKVPLEDMFHVGEVELLEQSIEYTGEGRYIVQPSQPFWGML
jgi:hypothetical protein